jgi:hypothetical protein
MFLIMCWWFISARKWFKGPTINVEHHMLGRAEAIMGIQGEQHDGSSGSEIDYTKSKEAGVVTEPMTEIRG